MIGNHGAQSDSSSCIRSPMPSSPEQDLCPGAYFFDFDRTCDSAKLPNHDQVFNPLVDRLALPQVALPACYFRSQLYWPDSLEPRDATHRAFSCKYAYYINISSGFHGMKVITVQVGSKSLSFFRSGLKKRR